MMAMRVLRHLTNYNTRIINSTIYPDVGIASVVKSSFSSAKQIMAGLEKVILGMGEYFHFFVTISDCYFKHGVI